MKTTVELRAGDFDPWRELAHHQQQLAPGKDGACAAFVGTMRDFNNGREVRAMTLEHYPGMTEKQTRAIAQRAASRHQLSAALILHRTGRVAPADPIVLAAAWAPHRRAAFTACREMMEQLKSQAPFWKQEQTASAGAKEWVGQNTPPLDCTTEIEAAVFRRLRQHLREHTEVQNIDLMNLADFCRNCLSKWYRAEAAERGLTLSDPQCREIIYGMRYEEWKEKYQV